MNSAEFLLWVRGAGLNIAMTIFTVGMLVRLVEVLMLGRKKNLAELRASGAGAGFRTIFSRSVPPDRNSMRRSMFTFVAGYGFHIGMLVTIFFITPHILVWPEEMLLVSLRHIDETKRGVTLRAYGARYRRLLARFKQTAFGV